MSACAPLIRIAPPGNVTDAVGISARTDHAPAIAVVGASAFSTSPAR